MKEYKSEQKLQIWEKSNTDITISKARGKSSIIWTLFQKILNVQYMETLVALWEIISVRNKSFMSQNDKTFNSYML